MLRQKINKKRPNIHQKTTLISTLQLGSILEPTWLDFGGVWGVKMVPRCQQIASKIDSKIDQKNDQLLDRLKIDFWTILGLDLGGPGGSVGGPSGDFLGSWSSLGAKMSPRAPQDPPRPLQEPSWDWFLTIWGSNLMVFIPNLSDFRPPTWWILQPTNQPNSQSTNQPNNQPTKPYIQTSLHP